MCLRLAGLLDPTLLMHPPRCRASRKPRSVCRWRTQFGARRNVRGRWRRCRRESAARSSPAQAGPTNRTECGSLELHGVHEQRPSPNRTLTHIRPTSYRDVLAAAPAGREPAYSASTYSRRNRDEHSTQRKGALLISTLWASATIGFLSPRCRQAEAQQEWRADGELPVPHPRAQVRAFSTSRDGPDTDDSLPTKASIPRGMLLSAGNPRRLQPERL